ncbi:MAG: hypothetical protein U9R17_10990 [Thermodesulfobacteriota bacterium]|nr:hypothetical protein [Thermodesulfobacteriota bacterium]
MSLAGNWEKVHEEKLKRYLELGWLRTETCAEYLLGIFPRKGDIVPMAGSCMQVANNKPIWGKGRQNGDSCISGCCSMRSNPSDGSGYP